MIIALIYIIKSLDFLYLFQIKEYRLDRISSFFKEEGFFKVFYFRQIRLPAKSSRNIGIIIYHLLIAAFLIILQGHIDFSAIILVLVFVPVLAFLTTFVAIILSNIPVQYYRKTLIGKAFKKIEKSNATFIGITGSYGKTSVKEILYDILSKKFHVAKSEKNYNTETGIALSILKNLKNDTQIFIAEMGAYKIGEIAKICRLVKPKYAILTGIGNQHLSLFGSKKKLLTAKSELLLSLPKNGKAYINEDIENIQELKKNLSVKTCFYSTTKKTDIYADKIEINSYGTTGEIFYKNEKINVKMTLLGKHQIENLLPCVAIAFDLGLNKNEIENAIKSLKPVTKRLSFKKGLGEISILEDTYNSNLNGFKAAIDTASSLNFGKTYILTRGIIELGEEKKLSYEEIADSINSLGFKLYTTDKDFKVFLSPNNLIYNPDELKLAKEIKNKSDNQTLVVLEGRLNPKTLQLFLKTNYDLN